MAARLVSRDESALAGGMGLAVRDSFESGLSDRDNQSTLQFSTSKSRCCNLQQQPCQVHTLCVCEGEEAMYKLPPIKSRLLSKQEICNTFPATLSTESFPRDGVTVTTTG